MHWLPNLGSQFIEKARLYNRSIKLPAHRLPHRVLLWDHKYGGHGWLNNFLKVIALIKYDDFIFGNLIDMKKFKDSCKMYFHNVINENCQKQQKPKLYQRLGLNSNSVNFIKNIHNKHRRSIVSKLFCGVLKLEIELGIYKRVPLAERFCPVCNNKAIEDPIHFIFECPTYELPRYLFLKTANVEQMYETFKELLFKETSRTAGFICDCWDIRKNNLFSINTVNMGIVRTK
ncbi:MAG: hypothetical protein MJE68_19950 [Proteobacteria bacterium]|nr:hypothetical protein [Pseudomonadota bacterium]